MGHRVVKTLIAQLWYLFACHIMQELSKYVTNYLTCCTPYVSVHAFVHYYPTKRCSSIHMFHKRPFYRWKVPPAKMSNAGRSNINFVVSFVDRSTSLR